MKAEHLPFADGEFDVATAIEVLEHVPDPAHTVAEMARVAQRQLLVSVPREPLWRGAQHGARRLPEGPRQHARARQPLVQALASWRCWPPRRGRRGALAVPVDDAARPASEPSAREAPASGYGRGARILSIGIATTGLVTFAYFSVASHVLDDVDYKQHLAAVVGAVRDRVGHLPADRAAAVAHDRRPARARPRAGHPLRTPLLIQAASRSVPGRRAGAARAARGRRSSTARRRSTGSWSRAVLFYAASYFARGWLAGHQWFGLYGGLVFMEACSRCLFALAVAVGIAQGRRRSRSAWRRRRSCRSSSCRGRSRPRPARRRAERGRGGARAARGGRLRASRCWRSCSPSRR